MNNVHKNCLPTIDIILKYCPNSQLLQYYDKSIIDKDKTKTDKKENIINEKNINTNHKIHYDNGILLIYSIGKLLYLKTNSKNTIKFKDYSINDIPIIVDIISIGDYGKIQSKLKTTHTSKWIYYYNVWIETEKNAPKLENIEKRGTHYSIDHIIPIIYGYSNNICPLKIGGLKNLRVISSIENIRKAQSIDISELYRIL